MYGVTCHHLVTFNSGAPGTLLNTVEVFAADSWTCLFAIDVDPRSGALYASWYETDCGFLCPTLEHGVSRLDPETGELEVIWVDPGTGLPVTAAGDFDVDPATGGLRTGGSPLGSNLHIDVLSGALVADTPFSPLRDVLALAFDAQQVPLALAARPAPLEGLDLFRLGGAAGVPPASSGELTLLTSIGGLGSPSLAGFDISPTGAAYLSAIYLPEGGRAGEGVPPSSLFFAVDLASGAAVPLGEIASPDGYAVTGIAVAGARGAIAIPALERGGVAALAVLLAAAGACLLARRRTA